MEKLKRPTKLSQLTELEQTRVQALIRKSLVTKVGNEDPTIVANEKKERLRNYHEKLGATLSEDRTEFTYNLPDVMNKINEIFRAA